VHTASGSLALNVTLSKGHKRRSKQAVFTCLNMGNVNSEFYVFLAQNVLHKNILYDVVPYSQMTAGY